MTDRAWALNASFVIALWAAVSQAAQPPAKNRTWWDGYSVAGGTVLSPGNRPRIRESSILLTAAQPPSSPVDQPVPPADDSPITQPVPETAGAESGGVDEGAFESAFRQFASQMATTASSSPDTAVILASAPGNETVRVQRRSQVSFDPRIRGYRQGQIYTQADGAYWRPARDDLDTVLSKIAPNTIDSIRVVNGPYGVQYGPGFAFIDVLTRDTPRYDCGFEAHNTIGLSYRTNGDQWYGYESLEGGNDNWGFRAAYGNRTGIDYESGDGTEIPASYHNQDYLAQIGYHFNPFQRLEFRFMHLDQTDTEYFGRVFDIAALTTDGFNLRLVDEDPAGPWSRFVVEGWYNDTRYHGDTSSSGKAATVARIERAAERALTGGATTGTIDFGADTNGMLFSTGARAAATFGDEDERNLTVGTDVRYLRQRLREQFRIDDTSGVFDPILHAGDLDFFYTNQPRSTLLDPGAFATLALPYNSYGTARLGGRVDWVHTDAMESDVRPDTALPGQFGGVMDLSRDDILYAFFIQNEMELNEVWTFDTGLGYAQRPPTLTERYADGLFLAIAQSGFSRVIGDPALKPERAWQIDAGLRGETDEFRGGIRGYYSWIIDYITYTALPTGGDPAGSRFLAPTINTPEATLAGFEIDGAYDLSSSLTLYGSVGYTEGHDLDLSVPLFGISPLEGRVGFRLHEPTYENETERWGVDFFARIVDNQHRLGALRNIFDPSSSFLVEEPTPGFTVFHLRAYAMATRNLKLTAGIENVFDVNYLEHLDLRLPAQPADGISELRLLAPGFTPYFGAEWTY